MHTVDNLIPKYNFDSCSRGANKPKDGKINLKPDKVNIMLWPSCLIVHRIKHTSGVIFSVVQN